MINLHRPLEYKTINDIAVCRDCGNSLKFVKDNPRSSWRDSMGEVCYRTK